MTEEWFPILCGYRIADEIRKWQWSYPFVIISIPWRMIAPFEGNAMRNHSQTLQRLAERGGLSANEALSVLDGRRYDSGYLSAPSANAELARRVQAFLAIEGTSQ